MTKSGWFRVWIIGWSWVVLSWGCDEPPSVPSPRPPPETESALDEAAEEPEPPPDPEAPGPHGGQRHPIPGGVGQIEWLPDSGVAYYLNPDGGPLKEIESAMLFVTTPAGPTAWALEPCGEDEFHGACGRVRGEWPKDAPSQLIRFELDRRPYRVRLVRERSTTRPSEAGGLPTAIPTER